MSQDFSEEAELNNEAGNKEGDHKINFFGHLTTSKEKLKEEKKAEVKSTGKKSLIQKIGIQNLCILLVLGMALIFLCYLENNKEKDKKKEENQAANQAATVGESLESNPIYTKTASETEEYISSLESKLKEKLAMVKGIGKVEVIISLAESKELVTLKDAPYTEDSVNEIDGEGGSRESNKITREDETVMSTTESGANTPYIIKEIQPTIGGVVVIAEGGTEPELEMDITQAVEALYGVPAHKIKVLEMDTTK